MKRSSFLKAMGLLAIAPLSSYNIFEKNQDLTSILEKYVVNSEKSVGRFLACCYNIDKEEREEITKRITSKTFNLKSPLTNDYYEIGLLSDRQIFMNNLSCIEEHIKKHPATTFEKYKFKQS